MTTLAIVAVVAIGTAGVAGLGAAVALTVHGHPGRGTVALASAQLMTLVVWAWYSTVAG